MAQAPRDQNFVPALLGVSSADGKTPIPIWVDPVTHRVLVDAGATFNATTAVFTATNNQTVFNVSNVTPITSLLLAVNGLVQTPTTDYTVSGSTATLTAGVPANTVVIWTFTY